MIGQEFSSKDHEGHGELSAGPDAVPLRHCNVDSQKPHPPEFVHEGHRPTEAQKSSESLDECCAQERSCASIMCEKLQSHTVTDSNLCP